MFGWVELKVEEAMCELNRLENITLPIGDSGGEDLRAGRRRAYK